MIDCHSRRTERHLTWNKSFTPALPLPFLCELNKPSAERKSGMPAAVEIPAPHTTTIRRAVCMLEKTFPIVASGDRPLELERGDGGVEGLESEGRGITIVIKTRARSSRLIQLIDTTSDPRVQLERGRSIYRDCKVRRRTKGSSLYMSFHAGIRI